MFFLRPVACWWIQAQVRGPTVQMYWPTRAFTTLLRRDLLIVGILFLENLTGLRTYLKRKVSLFYFYKFIC